jgi:hypothetical protein
MSTIEWPVVATIAAPIIALFVGAALNRFLERRPRVISYLGHVSGIRLTRPQDSVVVNTHSVVLRNAGRRAATNVRLGHAVLPDFQVFPDIDYTVRDLPGGEKEIVIPTLVPKKEVTVTYLYFPPLTWSQVNTHLESDDGPVRVIRVLPTLQLPKWAIVVLWGLIVYGVIALLYTVWVVLIK